MDHLTIHTLKIYLLFSWLKIMELQMWPLIYIRTVLEFFLLLCGARCNFWMMKEQFSNDIFSVFINSMRTLDVHNNYKRSMDHMISSALIILRIHRLAFWPTSSYFYFASHEEFKTLKKCQKEIPSIWHFATAICAILYKTREKLSFSSFE